MMSSKFAMLVVALLPVIVSAQLSGTVGPTTTRAEKKAAQVCNVLDYGGIASKTSDIGPPLTSAFVGLSERNRFLSV